MSVAKFAKGDYTILNSLSGGRLVISTKGYCRLISQPEGKPFEELVTLEHAHAETAMHQLNLHRRTWWLEAVDYETGKVLNFDNRGLSLDWEERYHQVHTFAYFGEKGDTIKRQRKIYHRLKGFKLGRLMRGPAKQRAAAVATVPKSRPTKPTRTKLRLRVAG